MSSTSARHVLVSGRVQGVFFRASTREKAQSLNLSGHAINLPDGSVEVLACGDSNDVKRLSKWLRDGPPMASVRGITGVEVACTNPTGFRTG